MTFQIYASPNGDGFLILPNGDSASAFSPGPQFSPDALFEQDDPVAFLEELAGAADTADFSKSETWAPFIQNQEVWAAGVTYFRSRTARMEEAESAGGDVFYDRVYEADRPELFFKAPASKTRGSGAEVCIRADSTWDVPEPELTLAINSKGKIFGYTIGNDMSSRSIEGENPLYLPQAKCYTGSCAIGPCLLVSNEPPEKSTRIALEIRRGGETGFSGETEVAQIKRGFEELTEFLFRANEFPHGAYLMTGTGIVPDTDFTLQAGDEVRISIDGIGTLVNPVSKIGG
ncbi:MAG: 2-hydroxyhepta-2,4-diene-1,7-dioate isomerase [Verrucomicrobiales bacterium]|nr:2-hydroxyhepta-2,4-diene-1,7-dioate isomerase [Verrucomicrobiales bacterium]